MKILFAAFLFCVVVAYSDRRLTSSKSDIEGCAQKNKIDKMILSEMKKNKTFTATPDTQCFAACLLKEGGIMLEDGTVNRDFVESDIASRCKNYFFAFGKDQCEIGAKILGCLYQKHVLVLPEE